MTEQAAPTNATAASVILDARKADREWGERVFNGDVAANKELRELTAQVAAGGDDTVVAAMNGNPVNMPTTDLAQMAHTTAMFRELGIRDEVTSEFLRGNQPTPQEYELVANWKKEKMGDAEFVKRFLEGGIKERQLMTIANSVLVNGIKASGAA